MPNILIDKDTALLLNEVRGMMILRDPKMKGTDNNVVFKALKRYKEGEKNGGR